MRARSWIITLIGAVSGVCFAAIAARSIGVLALSPHFFRASSLLFALIAVFLAYMAFRAAISGRADHASFAQALAGGVGGALAGLVIVCVAYAMFRQGARAYFAHPIGLRFPQVTLARLVIALLWLGFAAGFALRMPTLRRGRD